MDGAGWKAIAAALLLAYSVALIPYVDPEQWMIWVWIPLWLVITVPAVIHGVRHGGDGWLRASVPWSAAVSFSIVAILSAVLESRYYENVMVIFVPLGISMVGSVALFLMAYDRRKRPPAEVETEL